MMRNIICQLVAAIILLALSACGGSGKFKVTGMLSDHASTNLYVKYYDGKSVVSGVMPSHDGAFSVTLLIDQPSIVEIVDKENRVLARFYATKGGKVDINVNVSDPLATKMTGSPVNERWASVMNENAAILSSCRPNEINKFIADYISKHTDDVVSTLMFLTFYDASIDPIKADELFCSISPDAREASIVSAYMLLSEKFHNPQSTGKIADFDYRLRAIDSLVTFSAADKPLSVIVVTDDNSNRRDSVVPYLNEIWRDYGGDRLQMIDIGLYPDTMVWNHSVAADSAKWIQGWIPGGILSEELGYLAIPAVPYYILADSTGKQIYRGNSAREVKNTLRRMK